MSHLSVMHRFRIYVDIAVVVLVLVLTNLIAHFTTPWASIATVPAAAVGLVILVRSRGLGWAELGLSRQHWKSGLVYALAAVALVVAVISVGVLLPITRPMFMNHHYATISGAVIASMVMIPLQTVIPEELAFRGVLHGALNRAWGFRGVAVAGSVLFGLWHIATSLGLTSSNVGFTVSPYRCLQQNSRRTSRAHARHRAIVRARAHRSCFIGVRGYRDYTGATALDGG